MALWRRGGTRPRREVPKHLRVGEISQGYSRDYFPSTSRLPPACARLSVCAVLVLLARDE